MRDVAIARRRAYLCQNGVSRRWTGPRPRDYDGWGVRGGSIVANVMAEGGESAEIDDFCSERVAQDFFFYFGGLRPACTQ